MTTPLPQDVKALIPGTCEYVMLHGKRDFGDIIKLDLGVGEIILDYLGEPNKGPHEREAGVTMQRT